MANTNPNNAIIVGRSNPLACDAEGVSVGRLYVGEGVMLPPTGDTVGNGVEGEDGTGVEVGVAAGVAVGLYAIPVFSKTLTGVSLP